MCWVSCAWLTLLGLNQNQSSTYLLQSVWRVEGQRRPRLVVFAAFPFALVLMCAQFPFSNHYFGLLHRLQLRGARRLQRGRLIRVGLNRRNQGGRRLLLVHYIFIYNK